MPAFTQNQPHIRSIRQHSHRLDEGFPCQEATGQLGLDPSEVVAAPRLLAFLQGVVAVGEHQGEQLPLWVTQGQLSV